jgi:hypothetical protein
MARDRLTKIPLRLVGSLPVRLRTATFADSHDDGGQLRDVMPGVALASDVEVSALVLGKPLEPVEQEDVRVHRRPLVADYVVRGGVGVGEANSGRRLQEEDVGHCKSSSQRR